MSPRKLTRLLIALLAGVIVAFAPLPARPAAPGEKLVHLEASQFTYTPGEVNANPGDLVTIELVSTDVVHGLYLDGYGISVIADPGQTARLTFKADRPGSFRFRCNVTCGAMHPFMIGKLTIGRNDWLLRAIGLALVVAGAIILAPWKTG